MAEQFVEFGLREEHLKATGLEIENVDEKEKDDEDQNISQSKQITSFFKKK